MTIKTKFNLGDTAFTIDTTTLKVKSFTVASISTTTKADKTFVLLYDEGDTYNSHSYAEAKCFASQADLLAHLTAPKDEKQ